MEAPENIGSAMKSIISRYGELKTNPNATKDEEGEALSLNKVDTALQSVGITLQDVNGQFRNFDDVIGELGSKWDTIDVNTQRYIATIMAGNRQQSRFLALVSSYNRYQELSEKAANSANASQLQFLKTMDSVDYKLQQVQTSLQQLYLTTGVQNFYKTLLDWNNNYVQSLIELPKFFNLPISAIVKFGSQFTSLAMIVTNAFKMIKLRVQTDSKELAIIQSIARGEQLTAEQNSYYHEVMLTQTKYQDLIAITREGENQLTQAQQEGQMRRLDNAQIAAQQHLQTYRVSTMGGKSMGWGMGLAAGGLALQSIATNVNDKGWKAGLNFGGSVMSGVGQMIMMPGVVGKIIGGLTILNGLVEVFGNLWETAEERAKRLQETAEETKNAFIQQQDTQKTLEDQIKEYEKLKARAHDSAEAQQEFYEAGNKLAELAPELVNGYTLEGDALINLANAYAKLNDEREKTIETGVKAAGAAIELYGNTVNTKTLDKENETPQSTTDYLKEIIYSYRGESPETVSFVESLSSDEETLQVAQQVLFSDLLKTYIKNSGWINRMDQNPLQTGFGLSSQTWFSGKTDLTNLKTANDWINFLQQFDDLEGITIKPDDIESWVEKWNSLQLPNVEQSVESQQKILTQYIESQNYLLEQYAKNTVKTNIFDVFGDFQDNLFTQGIDESLANSYQGLSEVLSETFLQQLKTAHPTDWWKADTIDSFFSEAGNTIIEKVTQQVAQEIQNMKPQGGIEAYNSLLARQATLNRQEFMAKLVNLGLTDQDTLYKEALKSFDTTQYTYEEFESAIVELEKTAGKNSIGGWENAGFLNLGGSELLKALDFYKNLNNQVASDQLDTDVALNLFNEYSNLWLQINSMTDENLKDLASSKLQNWDFSLDGFIALIDDLKGFGLEIDKSATYIKDNLVVNLNTEYNNVIKKITDGSKDFETALKNIGSGMNFEDAVAMAQKLNTSIDNFTSKNGKFFLDIDKFADELTPKGEADPAKAFEAIRTAYLPDTSELMKKLNDRYDSAKNKIQHQLDTSANMESAEYKQLEQELKNLENTHNSAKKAIEDYSITMANRAMISAGYIEETINQILTEQSSTDVESVMKALAAHKYEIFSNEELAPYADLLIEAFKNGIKGIFDSAINSIKNGEAQLINVDASNRAILQALGAKDLNTGDIITDATTQAWLDLTYKDIGLLQKTLKEQADEGVISRGEADSIMASIEKLYSTTANDVLTNLVKNVEKGVERSEISNLANVLSNTSGKLVTAQELIDNKLFVYNEALGKYVYNLSGFESLIRSGAFELTLQQQNELLAQLEQADYDQGVEKVASEILNNRNKLTTDNLADLATRFGFSYDMIRNMVIDNGNGTFTMSLTNWKDLINKKIPELSGALLEVFSQEIDNIISSVTGLASGNGYTKVKDITTFTNQFEGVALNGEELNFKNLFKWSDTLHAWVLTQNGIIAQVTKARMELESADKGSEQYLAAQKLLKDTGRQLANNIDIKAFTQNMHSSKAIDNFNEAIENYNAYLRGMGQAYKQLDSTKLKQALRAGGAQAVAAAQEIARIQGNELSEDEIVSYYRSVTDKWYGTLDKVLSAPGTIVDAATARMIDASNGAVVNIKGTSKYVVQVAADITKVYGEILKRLKDSGTATLAEINAVAAKALEYKDGEQRVIDALSNAANMTYSQFGEILTNAGIELSEDLVEKMSELSIIKKLGGNKIAITDFNALADFMGWSADSEEYLSAFKTYRDSMIELNRRTENKIKDEVSNLTGAKAGDWINLTYLTNNVGDFLKNYEGLINNIADSIRTSAEPPKGTLITKEQVAARNKAIEAADAFLENIPAQLNVIFAQVGATFEDGILKITKDTDLLGLYQIFLDSAKQLGLTDEQQAQIQDARQQLINDIANLISNAAKGSLTNADVNSIKQFAAQHNVTLSDDDFTRTSSGLKLSVDKAGELYLKLKEIDSVAAEITFKELRKGLEESGRGAENAIQTTKKLNQARTDLLKNEKDIADLESKNERSAKDESDLKALRNKNKELKEQIQLYQDLYNAQYKDPDSYNFMERDLPDIYKGPQNYWNSVGKMFTSMNEASKSGYMALDDFYNIVNALNEMAAEGANIEFLGMKLDGSMESASALIQKGMGALANVDGKGAAVALKEFGSSFSGGAKDMAKGVTDGVHLVAKSQIQMLDAMINVLETVVALEKLKDAAGEDNVFDLSEIFMLDDNNKPLKGKQRDGTEGWRLTTPFIKGIHQLQEDLESNSELSEAFESISIDGVNLADLVKDASDGVLTLMDDYEGFQEIMNELITLTASDEYDINDPFGSVLKILKKTVTKPMEITSKENGTKIAIGWGVTLESDKEGNYTYITPDGEEHKTTDYKTALNNILASQQAENDKNAGGKIEDFTTHEDGVITYTNTIGEKVKVETSVNAGKTTYTLKDYPSLGPFDSQLDAMRAYAKQKLFEQNSEGIMGHDNVQQAWDSITDEQVDQYLEQTVGYTIPVNIESQVKVSESGKKQPVTKQVQDQIKQWLAGGKGNLTIDGKTLEGEEQQKFLAQYGIEVEPKFTLGDDTSIDDRNKLLSAFGLSEEDTILNMTASITTAEGDTAAKAIIDALNDTKTGLSLDLNITPKLAEVENDPAINKLIELLQGKQLEITVKFVTGEGTPTEGGVDADGSGEQTITGDVNSIIQQLKQLTLKADTTCIITLQDSAGKTYGTETNPIQINSPESASGTITLGKLVAVLGGSSTPGSGNANNTTNNAEFENPASEYDLIDANGQNITTTGHMNLSGFKASKPNGSTTATGRESAEYDGSTNVDLISPAGDFTGFLQILKLTAEQGSTMAKGSGQKKVIATLKDKKGNIIEEFDLSNLAEANAYLQAVKANEQSSTTYTLYDEDNNIESEIDVGGDQQKLDGIAAIGMLIAKKTSYADKTYAVLKDQNGKIITKVSLDRLLTAESWSNLIYSQLTPGGSVQLVDANNNPLTTLPSKLENPANPDGFTAEAIITSLLGDLPANVPVTINGKDENGKDKESTFSLEEGQSLSDVSAEIAGFTSTLSGKYPVSVTVGDDTSYYWPGKALTLTATVRDFIGQVPESKKNDKIYYVSFTTPDGVTYEADLGEDGVDLDTPINDLIALLPSNVFSDEQIQISSFITKTGQTAQDLSTQTYTLPSVAVIAPVSSVSLPDKTNIRQDIINAINNSLKSNGGKTETSLDTTDAKFQVGDETFEGLTIDEIQAIVNTFDLHTIEGATNVTYSGWITGDGSADNPWVFSGKAQYNIEEVDVNNKPVDTYDPLNSDYGSDSNTNLSNRILKISDIKPGQAIGGKGIYTEGGAPDADQANYYNGYIAFFEKVHGDISNGTVKKEDMIYLINLIDMLNGQKTEVFNPEGTMGLDLLSESYGVFTDFFQTVHDDISDGTVKKEDLIYLLALIDMLNNQETEGVNSDTNNSLLKRAQDLFNYFERINSIDTETSPLVNIMTLFSELDIDQILSFAEAMQSLAKSAALLEAIKWSLISEGLTSVNTVTQTTSEDSDNGEPNGVEKTTELIRKITLNYNVEYGENTYLKELFEGTLQRTVQVTMSYVNGGGDGGNGGNNGNSGNGGTTGNSSGGNSSGSKAGTTVTPSLNLDSVISALTATEATAASVSSNIQTSLSALSDPTTTAKSNFARLRQSIVNIPNSGETKVDNFSDALKKIPGYLPARINNIITALNKIPSSKTINLTLSVKVTGVNGNTYNKKLPFDNNDTINATIAKGNVALAKGRTLMGELGPELVVSNGHYFLAGENGAEMVDLADDAIVFNHLQTKKLLENGNINGRGQPITNERKATSFATGNLGPAMASAEQALSALKELRKMWQSMLEADAKSLGTLAGRSGSGSGKKGGGGNGGNGSGGKDKDNTGYIHDLEIWYNLVRQIDKIEKDITYQESLQTKLFSDRIANGKAIYKSYKQELNAITQNISKNRELLQLQKDYYINQIEDINSSKFGQIFTYTKEGLQQYNSDLSKYIEELTKTNSQYFDKDGNIKIKGTSVVRDADGNVVKDKNDKTKKQSFNKTVRAAKTGLDFLALLNSTDVNGAPVYTSEEQVEILKAYGFGDLIAYDSKGKKIDTTSDDAATKMMESFWNQIDAIIEDTDNLYDSIQDTSKKILEQEDKQNQILQKIVDNQLDVEQTVLKSIEDREQKAIDELQKERDAVDEANQKFLDGLKDQLDKERKMYEQNEKDQELVKLQRQLAILQRSGGSAAQIRSLQDQISNKQRDTYFDNQEKQIDAIQEASDKEIERLDAQIDLMTETLEYQKEHGLLWNEVYQVMALSEDEIKQFVTENGAEWESKSSLQIHEDLRELTQKLGIWIGYRDDENPPSMSSNGWETVEGAFKERFSAIWDAESANAKRVYNEALQENGGDTNKADEVTREYLNKRLQEYEESQHNDDNSPQNVTLRKGDKGEYVKQLQQKLKDLGYNIGKAGVDGIFGRDTEAAIKKFQKEHNLSPDGIAGAKTLAALGLNFNNEQPATTNITLRKGNRGDNVKKLQKRLSELGYNIGTVDGIFGEQTLKAVQAFQKDRGLIVDGIVGKKTIAALGIHFKKGGLADFTGPAWLDGTKSRPESVFDADTTRFLRNDFLKGVNTLRYVFDSLSPLLDDSKSFNGIGTQESINIQQAQVIMQVEHMNNDYDAQRAGEAALEEMLKIARKSGTRGTGRR